MPTFTTVVTLPIDASLAGLSVRTGRLLRSDDVPTDPRIFQAAARRAGWRSIVVMPLRHRGAVVGALQVMSRAPGRFGKGIANARHPFGIARIHRGPGFAQQSLIQHRSVDIAYCDFGGRRFFVFAFADFHERFVKDRRLVVFCPKLDRDIDAYIDKLAVNFARRNIRSTTILRMEVPCCGGTETIVAKALEKAAKSAMVQVKVVSLRGELL